MRDLWGELIVIIKKIHLTNKLLYFIYIDINVMKSNNINNQ